MKLMIIPADRVEKLKSMKFPQDNEIDPIISEINGKTVYYLHAELKDDPTFSKALADFEVCEIKEIQTIEAKSYDSQDTITTDINKAVTTKIILTEIKEPIDPIITK